MKARYRANAHDQAVFAELHQAVERALLQHYEGAVIAQPGEPEVLSFTNSFLLRYRIAAHPAAVEHVYVKIRRHPKMTSLSATLETPQLHRRMREEYDSLSELYAMFNSAGPDFGAVRPLAYLPRWHAIVLEEFAGQTLRQCLMQAASVAAPRARRERLCVRAGAAGRWLRRLHDAAPRADAGVPLAELHSSEIRPLVRGLRDCGLGARICARVLQVFDTAMQGHETRPVLCGRSAEDFTTDNVLCDQRDRVAVIDVKLRTAPWYGDLALALVHPQTYRTQFLSSGAYFSREALRRYREAMLEGYCGPDRPPAVVLNHFCARNLLDKWLMYERIVARHRVPRRWLTGAVAVPMRRYFERQIGSYLAAATPGDTR